MMDILSTNLYWLHQNDSEVADIIDAFVEINQMYAEIRQAIGITSQDISFEGKSSANAGLLFGPSGSTYATDWEKTVS
jgi:hypothetical protein